MGKDYFYQRPVSQPAVVADQWKHLTIDRKVFCNAEAELAKLTALTPPHW